YALTRHVQLIPYLDAPGHDAFILKHPEYMHLRAFPHLNYEMCLSNPKTYQLISSMFDNLLDANKGGKYVWLSTDEPYFVGIADNYQCHERDQIDSLGERGKLLANFESK